jgi:manganese oxidase
MPTAPGRFRFALLIVAVVFVTIALYARFSVRDPGVASGVVVASNDMREPAGTLRDGVLTVALEARAGEWYPDGRDGMPRLVAAFAVAGRQLQNPGPLIRVRAGTKVRVSMRNSLDRPLTVFGLGEQRGITQDSAIVDAGASRELEFDARTPGVYYYLGKTTPAPTIARTGDDSQLNGVIMIDPADGPIADDRIFVLSGYGDADSTTVSGLKQGATLTINGREWPHTPKIEAMQGELVRFHLVNTSFLPHPMHLHGFYFTVDGNGDGTTFTRHAAEERAQAVTEYMAPGSTVSVSWMPDRPGNWILHCHFAGHMSTWDQLNRDRRYPSGEPASHGAAPASPGAAGARHGAAHGGHNMGGLVVGITVRPNGRATALETTERPVRLIVRSKPNVYGEYAGYGYVLGGTPEESDPDALPVPGPLLLLEKGSRVAVNIVNQSHEPAAVHWHGIELESYPDGVPGWSGQRKSVLPAIAPGDSLTVRYRTPRAGTFMFHSHFNEFQQIASGMYAPLIVLEPGQRFDPETDRVLLFSDNGPTVNVITGPFPQPLLNGQASPQPLRLQAGTRYRLRFINIRADYDLVVRLLDGDTPVEWTMIARDGADVPAARQKPEPALLHFAAGQIFDFEFTPAKSGELRLQYGYPPQFPVGPDVSVPVLVRPAALSPN